jgi:hypothetical protein
MSDDHDRKDPRQAFGGKDPRLPRRKCLGERRRSHDPRRLRPGHHRHLPRKFGRNAKVWDRRQGGDHSRSLHLHGRREVPSQRADPPRFRAEQGCAITTTRNSSRTSRACPIRIKDPTKTNYKGVCHKALPEEGHIRPGEILLGTDSHTCTAGAFGQFATGVGNTDAAFVLGTGKTWLKVPPTMKFTFHGRDSPLPHRQGFDPGRHRRDRRRWRDLPRHVFRRRRDRIPHPRRPHDPDQHGHRSRREERRLRCR